MRRTRVEAGLGWFMWETGDGLLSRKSASKSFFLACNFDEKRSYVFSVPAPYICIAISRGRVGNSGFAACDSFMY